MTPHCQASLLSLQSSGWSVSHDSSQRNPLNKNITNAHHAVAPRYATLARRSIPHSIFAIETDSTLIRVRLSQDDAGGDRRLASGPTDDRDGGEDAKGLDPPDISQSVTPVLSSPGTLPHFLRS